MKSEKDIKAWTKTSSGKVLPVRTNIDYKNLVFEEFTEVGRRSGNIPKVTITKTGSMNFNKVFVENYISDKMANLIFHYDRGSKAIGLNIIAKPQKNSNKVRVIHEGDAATVSARAFLKYYDIPFEKTRSYEAHCDPSGRLIVFL